MNKSGVFMSPGKKTLRRPCRLLLLSKIGLGKVQRQCDYFCCFVFPDHLCGLDLTNPHSQAVFPNWV